MNVNERKQYYLFSITLGYFKVLSVYSELLISKIILDY